MNPLRIRALAALGCAAAIVAAATACTSDKVADSPSSSSVAKAPTVPTSDLLITLSDLPGGYTELKIPAGTLNKSITALTDSLAGARISPAQCAASNPLPAKFDVAKVGVAAFTNSTTSLSTAVFPVAGDIGRLRSSYAGPCATMSATLTSGEAAGATTTVATTVQSAPTTKADDALTVQQVSDVALKSGQKVHSTALIGWATVRGYSVTVQSGGALGEPDRGAFDKAFVRAVAKVAESR